MTSRPPSFPSPRVPPAYAREAQANFEDSRRATGGAHQESPFLQARLAYVAPPLRPRRNRIIGHIIGILGFAAVLLGSFYLNADQQQVRLPSGAALPPLCALKGWTGVSCPGCGLTRCFVHLMHGKVADAWAVSPAGILFFLLIAAQIPLQAWQLARAIRRRPDPAISRWTAPALVIVAALLIAQWGLRLAG